MPDEMKQLKAKLKTYLERSPVTLAYLYGSYVKGNANQDSDIDIGVLLGPNVPPAGAKALLANIESDIADMAGVPAQVESIASAPPLLKHSMVLEGELLFERDRDERIKLEVLTLHEYEDNRCIFDIPYQVFKQKLGYEPETQTVASSEA